MLHESHFIVLIKKNQEVAGFWGEKLHMTDLLSLFLIPDNYRKIKIPLTVLAS